MHKINVSPLHDCTMHVVHDATVYILMFREHTFYALQAMPQLLSEFLLSAYNLKILVVMTRVVLFSSFSVLWS